MVIQKDKFVTIHYDLLDDKDVIIDSSREEEPLDFIQGYGFLVEGLQNEMEGKKKGDSFQTVVSPELGYGVRDESLVFVLNKSDFGDQVDKIHIGQELELNSENGEFVVTVTAMTKESITLDGNHPLAGMPLKFNIDVLNVRDASEEEIEDFLAHDHDHDEDDEHECCGGHDKGGCSCS
ncbi:MAG: hypothetical protein A2015_09030 [Spirochaetes bacterium GWF1_31_7]|nr:MAG: hypothetical protein A2Y30_09190 [Spirochaetes bacterium GWE1_32_154]OHD46617.1 MAG: hypothetical protein A2Y29_07665 [Spirochaetes bacterium GWE2_31_10]OHD47631.1 MAG: hypothetical protein A2015_09030 [Spirochaetes bacterium GWF1_31_7]HBD94409.1 peptidylprolyl isomerase [Spirochaetia bacterium]HBI37654.1 peptidylprolyl isomerase [Spirochaetia bacterium]